MCLANVSLLFLLDLFCNYLPQILQVGAGWEECKLNEFPNDYVDALCSRCSCIWASLSISPKTLPIGVRNAAWEDMMEGAYGSMLEGFSRVPFCSTEGRALMSMDLASFACGVSASAIMERLEYDNKYVAPPQANARKGMRYVDTYVKVFYYPPKVRDFQVFAEQRWWLRGTCLMLYLLSSPRKDVMAWIIENHGMYQLNHCITLAANAFCAGGDSDNKVEETLEVVRKIYKDGDSANDSADSNAQSSVAARVERV